MPRGVYDRDPKPAKVGKPNGKPPAEAEDLLEVEVRTPDEIAASMARTVEKGLAIERSTVAARRPIAAEEEPAPFRVAWIQPFEAITFPGMKPIVSARIDPMTPEWDGWRIIIAGATVLLVAPSTYHTGVRGPDGGLADGFEPVAAANGWTRPEDVRQVFEIPRSKVLIRYYIDAEMGDALDGALAAGLRAKSLAAPDDRTRAAFLKIKADREAVIEAERSRELRLERRAAPRAPTPAKAAATAKVSTPPAAAVDDEAGIGDEGPEDDEE